VSSGGGGSASDGRDHHVVARSNGSKRDTARPRGLPPTVQRN
jgi:hypothetical protein